MSISFKHSDTYHSRDIAKEFSEQNGITPDQAMSQSYQFHLRKMFDDVGIRLIQGRIYFHDGEGENNHARDVKNLKEFIADTATLVNHLSDAVDDIEAHYAKAQHEFREHFRSEYYEPESDKTFDEQYARFVELENS